jgi:hypothetical protein
MATFLARTITESGGSLPSSAPDAFADDLGSTHEPAINRLAAVGVVQGKSARSYDPGGRVTRAQMATFLARAYEYRAGQALPDGSGFFSDTGGVHERNIDRVAAAGITGGASARRYEPDRSVTRAQMASFLARLLDLLVDERVATLPPSPAIYFADIPLISQSLNRPYRTSFGAASVSGDSYLRSVIYELRGTANIRWREWDLGRDYVRLRATLGLRDDTGADTRGVMRVYLDGVEAVEVPIQFGRSVPLDLDVRGVLRVRLEVQNTTDGQSFWVWGNARVNAW